MPFCRASDPYRLLYQLEAREIGISMFRTSFPKFAEREEDESEEESDHEEEMRFRFPFRDHFDSDDEDDDLMDDDDDDDHGILNEIIGREQRAILEDIRASASNDDPPSLEEISSSSEESIDIYQPETDIEEFSDPPEANEQENLDTSIDIDENSVAFQPSDEAGDVEDDNEVAEEENQETSNSPMLPDIPVILDGSDHISDVTEGGDMSDDPPSIISQPEQRKTENSTPVNVPEPEKSETTIEEIKDITIEEDDSPARKKAKITHEHSANESAAGADDPPTLEHLSDHDSEPHDIDAHHTSVPESDEELPTLLSASDSEEETATTPTHLSKRTREQMTTNENTESQEEGTNQPEIPHNQFTFQYTHHKFRPVSFGRQVSAQSFFIKRMHPYKKLQGHTGCVNTINWSNDGQFLISGGDDTTVAIWDYELGSRCRQRIHTGHVANIFSAKFLPNGSNDYVASCARDGKVLAFNIELGALLPHEEAVRSVTGIPLLDCKCHRSEVKRLTVDKENPMVFQSCGADGNVFLHDIREPHTCNAPDSMNYLVRSNNEIFSMDANPLRPYEFVVSGSSPFIFLYDKR